MAVFQLFLRRSKFSKPLFSFPLYQTPTAAICLFSSIPSPASDSTHQSPPPPKPTSLSARMSFLFDQIDQIDRQRDEKHQTLQRIRSWRQENNPEQSSSLDSPQSDTVEDLKTELVKSEALMAKKEVKVELVHPWPEWIELMERLVQQNYFDHRRKDEDGMMEGLGFDLSDAAGVEDDKGLEFTRDFKTVQAAMVNFGKDRFDILRSLSRQDLQILVGYGCPSADKKVVFSCKLLRKHVHLDEGDVCSSCSLRSSCEKAYLLTNKEDEARTIDVMRLLLAYGFDSIDGSVVNKSVLKIKSVKTVVRKLLHEVVKLSAVPIDPNLPPPIIKKPPPKVKQPPPPPKKRVGRNDIEMKKGDWLCPKCDFMNFAKNSVCLQCDAKRPKRQLLPGEWECPQCNFLNYRRNTVCFHCEHNRPPDTYAPPQFPDNQNTARIRMEKTSNKAEVSNAWNFDFDDNESDGADVAAFEFADSQKLNSDFSLGKQTLGENSRSHRDGLRMSSRPPELYEREHSGSDPMRRGIGFNDFDEEDEDDVDSYELVSQNEVPKTSRIDFSDLELDSESDNAENFDENRHPRGKTSSQTRTRRPSRRGASFSHSEDDEVDLDSDDDLPIHPKWKSSHVADSKRHKRDGAPMSFVSDDDLGFSSDTDDESFTSTNKGKRRGLDRVDHGSRGRSHRASEPFSDVDSDDDFSYHHRNKQGGRGPSGKPIMGRSGGRTDFTRSSGFQRETGGIRGESRGRSTKNARVTKSSNFRSHREGESFDRRGGRSKNFNGRSESVPNDERNLRPRLNVR